MRRGHLPIRTCIGCLQKKRQDELVRLEMTPEGKIIINEKRGKGKRGYYLCPTPNCFTMAKKRSKLAQSLRGEECFLSFKERLSQEGIR